MLSLRGWKALVFLLCLYSSQALESVEDNISCATDSYYHNRSTNAFRKCDKTTEECPVLSQKMGNMQKACLFIIRYRFSRKTETTFSCTARQDEPPLFEQSYAYITYSPVKHEKSECIHGRQASICYCLNDYCNSIENLKGLLASATRNPSTAGRSRLEEILADLSIDISYLVNNMDTELASERSIPNRIACLQERLDDLQLLSLGETTVNSKQVFDIPTSTEFTSSEEFAEPGSSTTSVEVNAESGFATGPLEDDADRTSSLPSSDNATDMPTKSTRSATTQTPKTQGSHEATTQGYTTGKAATEHLPSANSSSTGWHIGSAVFVGLLVVVIISLAILLIKQCGDGKKGNAKKPENMEQPKKIKIEKPPIRNVNEILVVTPLPSVPTIKPVAQEVHATAGPEEDTLMTGQEDSMGDAGIDSTTSGFSDSTGTEGSSQATVTVRGFSQK